MRLALVLVVLAGCSPDGPFADGTPAPPPPATGTGATEPATPIEVAPFATFGPAESTVGDPMAADFNGDGLTDLAVVSNGAYIFFGPVQAGSHSLAAADVVIPVDDPMGAFSAQVAGDQDGDGRVDLWVGDSEASYVISVPDSGTVDPAIDPIATLEEGTELGFVTDVDMDGAADVVMDVGMALEVVYGPLSGTIVINRSGGNAGSRVEYPCTNNAGSQLVPLGDLTNDDVPEYYFALRGDSFGTLDCPARGYIAELAVGRGVTALAADIALVADLPEPYSLGDVDGDGVGDVNIYDAATHVGGVYSGAGLITAPFESVPTLLEVDMLTGNVATGLGDLDASGTGDLLVRSTAAGSNLLSTRLFLTGPALPAGVVEADSLGVPMSVGFRSISVFDVDLDGDLAVDLVGKAEDSLTISVFSGAAVIAALPAATP